MMDDTNVNLSLQASLLQQTQALAQKLNISWTRLIVLALKDFIRRHQAGQQLLEEINAAYAEESDENDLLLVQQMRFTHRRLVKGGW